jgi:hypothetical protein
MKKLSFLPLIVTLLNNSWTKETDTGGVRGIQISTVPDNRSITRYLNSLVADKVIDRVKKGSYKKL